MNSNNDNKERFTEGSEEELCDKSEENAGPESEEIEESDENLLEIISGELDCSEEKISLADVVKSTFDLDENISEDRVVDNADEEVVFAAPERIMNFIEDYLNNVEDEGQNSENAEFVPSQTTYFSTDILEDTAEEKMSAEENKDALNENYEKRDIRSILDEIFADEEESAEDTAVEEAAEASEDEEKSVEDTAVEEADEASEDEEKSAEDTAVEEAAEVSEDEEKSAEDTAVEEAAEVSEDEVSEDIYSENEIEFSFKEADEISEQDDVDLYEIAEIEPDVMQEEYISEEISNDTEDDEAVCEDESKEELPAIFTQGRDALIGSADDLLAEASESEDESGSVEEHDTDDLNGNDEESMSALTVHRHKDKENSDEDDDDYYDEYYDGENAASKRQSFFKRHSIAAWAKRKTAGGWAKFALKCVGVMVLVLCATAVLYVNGKLNLINYKDADDFEQFYNLSDTDYVSSSDEGYENPVYYNSSTTIEGFDESMIDIPKEDVVNILLIGTDVRGGTYDDRGNTDSMILLSINTRDKNIKLTSFMRDMYVTIPGRGKNRLNAAYAYGGPQLLFDTLKVNFDVDVDLYARVNFSNFKKIINKVGGIEIELTQAEARYMNKYAYKYKTDPVEAGLQVLDGAQALSYARCRKIDSDFNRTQRQRKVIVAFVDSVKGCSLTELNDLLNILLPMIQTNVPKMQIVGLMVDALSYLNTEVETLNVPIKNSWQSAKINKMDVICPNFELNKTAIVAHIYSTYKLDVEDTVFQSFEIPAEGRTTTRKTTTTAATTTTTESTTESTESSTSADISQTSTTTKKTYWWENTTTPAPTTTTTAPPQTTASTSSQGIVFPQPGE